MRGYLQTIERDECLRHRHQHGRGSAQPRRQRNVAVHQRVHAAEPTRLEMLLQPHGGRACDVAPFPARLRDHPAHPV